MIYVKCKFLYEFFGVLNFVVNISSGSFVFGDICGFVFFGVFFVYGFEDVGFLLMNRNMFSEEVRNFSGGVFGSFIDVELGVEKG